MQVAAIILAAGASTRMGKSKQRLPWKSGTLLTHAVGTARQAGLSSVAVVLGADEDQNRGAITGENVTIVSNPGWERGMGSSLKAGLKNVLETGPMTDAVLVMVCDQPFVTGEHLRALAGLISKPQTKAAFSRYAGTTGVPAVFRKDLFDAILALGDDHGAKGIIRQLEKGQFETLELKNGEIDLDTYEQYLKHSNEG